MTTITATGTEAVGVLTGAGLIIGAATVAAGVPAWAAIAAGLLAQLAGIWVGVYD